MTVAELAEDAPSAASAPQVPPPSNPAKLRFLRPPTFGGAVVGLLLWWRSLFPTLMPRTWITQAAITALCAAVGYAVGTLGGHVAHRLLQRWDREPGPVAARRSWWAVAGAALLVLVLSLVAWPAWQDGQRDLLGLVHLPAAVGVPMVLLAVVLLVLLVWFGRLIGRGVQRLHRFNARHLPSPVAVPLTVVLVAGIGLYVVRDVVLDALVDRANAAFGLADEGTNEGTEQPTSPLVSGSPDSLVAWDTLGVQGRDFVAQATPVERMAEHLGADVDLLEPIRVYTGLDSADSLASRADLAVDELERTGAFDRSVLVVATTTGTGWVDPDAVEALEVMHGGDTAVVAMQYSFLPSWISSLVDKEKATDAGAALFAAVHERWSEAPEDQRPELIAFGLSLGSYGGEAAFSGVDGATSVANLVARTDGALFVGPTNDNVIWNQLTSGRDAGSPAWWPVFAGGDDVRFTNRGPDPNPDLGDWPGPRILYVQHPSDPVTFWGMDTLWSKPEWMDSPRGYDVPDQGGWFPFVTWGQGVFDLMAGFGAPPGHGHDYRLDYVDAWGQVVPPDGWTEQDQEDLEQFLFDS